jgi:hypothetical protein
LLAAPGHAYNLSAPGEFSTGEVGNFQPAETGEYSTGVDSQVVVQTPEEALAYTNHCKGFHESLAPEGAVELSFAQNIADDQWRINRSMGVENSFYAMLRDSPEVKPASHPEVEDAFAHALAWVQQGKNFNLMSLYASRAQRRLEKNLAMLQKLQADRRAALKQAAEEARLLAQHAASKGQTYDIERDFPPEAYPPQFVFSAPKLARLVAHNARLAEAKKPRAMAA